MSLQPKNWTLNTYTTSTWTDLVNNEGVITTIIAAASVAAATISIRLVNAAGDELAVVIPAGAIGINESTIIDARSLSITAGQKLQVKSDVAGVSFLASGAAKV